MTSNAADGSYGDNLDTAYDLMYAGRPDVATLPSFCRSIGPDASTVLEFGIGNGRLAIPMAESGFHVTGIDTSQSMIDTLRARAGDLPVTAIKADFRNQSTDDVFDLALILTNTLFMLETIDDKRRTLAQARGRLRVNGHLVVETYDPHVYLERPSPFSVTLPLGPSMLLTDTVIVDRLKQMVTQVHAISTPTRIDTVIEHSYWLTPRELDLLAGSVGLVLTDRFSDFERRAVTSETRNLVSVYSRTGAERS
ncbi:class I SAM-dependent methyltransferase [Microbacterium lacticum]|uniref:class I SAM-dependent methyltransferase n=2 Tax=Microbacterium lacticum TaxID=33885 RepID=UPI00259A9FB4|nr:class I SAM-dependent methyltransferase [uncultured Microbacterium sp.]